MTQASSIAVVLLAPGKYANAPANAKFVALPEPAINIAHTYGHGNRSATAVRPMSTHTRAVAPPASLRCRTRTRRSVAIGKAQRPPDRFEVHLGDLPVVPHLRRVPQGRVEYPPLPICLRPRQRKVAVSAP